MKNIIHSILTFSLVSLPVAMPVFAGTSDELSFLQKETQAASEISESQYNKMVGPWNESMKKSGTATLEASASRKEAFRRVALANEDFTAKIEQTIVLALRRAFEKTDTASLKEKLSAKVSYTGFDALASQKMKSVDGIKFAVMNSGANQFGTADQVIVNLKKYLGDFKTIEFVDAKITKSGVGYGDIAEFKKIYMPEFDFAGFTVFFEVRGIMQNGFKRSDKFNLKLLTEKSSAGYKIAALEIINAVTAQATREPSFKTAKHNAGFDSGKVYPRLEALRRGGYAFSVEDFNNDGRLDAFVGNYGESAIWTGQDNGDFKQISAEEVSKVTLAKAAAFVDLNNDGWKDLVITRFAADNLVGDVLLFKNENGKFTAVKNAFPSDILRDYAMPMAIADYNNDGMLDIYIGFPGERDFSAGPAPSKKMTVAHGLFLNKGDFKFIDDTKQLEKNFRTSIAPHGSLATDVDMDGKVDIVIMDDQKNLSPLYQNNGDGSFTMKNADLKIMNYGYGMGITAGDFNQDGMQDYVLSNATFTPQDRLLVPHTEGFGFNLKNFSKSVRLFYNGKGNAFTEDRHSMALLDSGEGAGGATAIDYDNDGLQDIYLVNGLWSGSSRDENIDSLFAKATKLDLVNISHMQDGVGERSPDSSKSIFMKVLMKDRVAGDKSLSFGGYQRNRLYKNLGNGEFLEVGYLEGVDSLADGYMSVVADVNRDGQPDLLLRNCDPGNMAYAFPVIEVFENNHKSQKSLWLTLKGKTSNSSGVGARIYATVGKKQHYREVFANNSAAQGEISAHVGLGSSSAATVVKIVWPSGVVDVYKNVKAGRHTFEEKENMVRKISASPEKIKPVRKIRTASN
ncbi:MAG: yrrB 1 [Pseudobdellovibrio sp.]|nr:yrrB 1 [Pseudobdellovibrio sp.]